MKKKKRKFKFVAEVPAESKLVNFRGRIFVAHPNEPVREIHGDELIKLFTRSVKLTILPQ